MEKNKFSIVVPVFNEQGNLPELTAQLVNVLENRLKISYEIIFIDDGSEDRSWEIIEGLKKENFNVRGIRFSRNFGHQYALKAGIDNADGDAVVTMDADLQHPPELIIDFYEKWKSGYKVVQGIRKDTKGAGLFKRFSSSLYYRLINFISDVKIITGSSDMRLIDRQVADEVIRMKEGHLCLRGIIPWLGFEESTVDYVAPDRYSGETKFTFRKMFRFAVDGIMSFSIKPLRLSILAGFVISLVAFAYIIFALVASLVYKMAIPGWTSILVSVLFLGGMQLISIGILGEYVGKIFIENKRRENYIIKERI